MSSKIVLLQGGLGNQLFQYAWARYMVDYCSVDAAIHFNLVRKQRQHNAISLSDLVGDGFYESLESCILFRDSLGSKIFRLLLRKMNVRTLSNCFIYDYDASLPFREACESIDAKYHFGYFQFVDAAVVLRASIVSEIASRHEILLDEYRKRFSGFVGVHVRRGDFLTSSNQLHGCVTDDFLNKSITLFPGRKFAIFSDDPEWCKSFFNGDSFFVNEPGSLGAIGDFLGMMSCRDYIIGGSTFGWWSAFLGADEKTNICIPPSNALFLSVEANKRVGWNCHVVE